jgi:ABC-type branched-subunit amino acid transport system substrate-binding protein
MCYINTYMPILTQTIVRVQAWVLALTVLCLLSLQAVVAQSDPPSKAPRLSVGVIIPLTGDIAWFGIAFKRGIEMAQAEGVADRITFLFDDDRSGDRAATISALNSLIRQNQVRVTVFSGAPNVTVASPILNKVEMLGFSAIDSNARLDALGDNIFGYGYSSELTSQQIANYACDKIQAKKAAIVGANDEWSETMAASFERTFIACGGKILSHDTVNLDDVDLRSLATKITRSSPDVVYFPLYRASLITFAKQIRQSGYSGTLLSADGISEAEVRILGPSAEGIIITSAYLENEAFERRYLSQFKLAQLDYNLAHVALGHEIAKFLNAAVEWLEARKLQPTTDNLREAVKSITIEDMLGTISFGGKHSIERRQILLEVRNRRLRPIDR